jgi:hypothetical protein
MNRSAMYNFVLVPIGPPIKEHTIRTIFLISLKCQMNSVARLLIACYTKLKLVSSQKHSRSCAFGNTFSRNDNYGVTVRMHPIASYTSCTVRYFSRALMELRRTLNPSQKL